MNTRKPLVFLVFSEGTKLEMISLKGQCFNFIPPENTRKPQVFRGYKMRTLTRNRLNVSLYNAYCIICGSLFVETYPLSAFFVYPKLPRT